MKKLLVLITILSTSLTFANAQGYGGNRDYARNSNQTRNNDWRYDKDYRAGKSGANSINSFQRDAREHIAQGIIEGSITSREAARLLEIAERIEVKENRYMRRGGLDRKEVDELRDDLRNLDNLILRERRDNDRISIDDHKGVNNRKRY